MFDVFFYGNRRRKEVALTFDDGPADETLEVLKLFKKYGAKGTFFVIGSRINGRENIIEKIKKEGHEIGNHTNSHKILRFKPKSLALKEIKECDRELSKVGVRTNLFRFPCFQGGLNSYLVCRKIGKKMIFTDVASKDWKTVSSKERTPEWSAKKIEEVSRKVISKTKNGSIINFHDYLQGFGSNEEIVPILEKVLPALQKKGFKFVTVSKVIS
jgi:peptidoglycan/xylan/chitin deacetylase (PgdA/CDA1 family)